MSEIDPYAAPTSDLDPYRSSASNGGDDARAAPHLVELLRQTKPWVTFLAIVGFVFAGLMVLLGLLMMVFGAAKPTKFPWPFGLVYLLLALLYIFPSLFLLRYGAAIRRLLDGNGMNALTDALREQKSFWRLVGIMTAVVLCIYALGLVGAFIFGLARAASGH